MNEVDRLSADANGKVERWLLSQYRAYYTGWKWVTPLGATRAHLLCCPAATAGPVSGGDEDISEVTAGGMVHLEGEITCPHGERDWFSHRNHGDLADVLADLDDPEWQEVAAFAELPSYMCLWCPTCWNSVEHHLIGEGVTSAINTHRHDVEVVVICGGVVKERQPLVASGERWRVELP